jgi:LemA protein
MNWIAWVIFSVVVVGLYGWYATIVTRRNRVSEALSGVDVQLQQRHDLIPNLLTIARRFMEHERDLLQSITDLRNQASAKSGTRDFSTLPEKFAAEAALDRRMSQFFAVAENYPQLRSDGPMMEAQRSYHEVETNIAAARRFYNATVAELQNAVQVFPGSLLRGLAGVTTLPPFFQKTEAAVAPVDASRYL